MGRGAEDRVNRENRDHEKRIGEQKWIKKRIEG